MDRRATLIAACIILAVGTTRGIEAAVPIEREIYREAAIGVPGTAARPIGAIDFSASTAESRRFGPWDHDVHRLDGEADMIFYDDGAARGSARQLERQVRYDKWGRRCTTVGALTTCKGVSAQ
jgi:hypothetical protein